MSTSAAAKARHTVLAIEIPRDALAVRIAIPIIGAKPPSDADPAEALDQMDRINPGLSEDFRRAADAAVKFFHECINAGRQPS